MAFTDLVPLALAFGFGAGGGAILTGIGAFVIFVLSGRRESRRQVREERRVAYAEFVALVDEAAHLLWIAHSYRASGARVDKVAMREIIKPIRDAHGPFLRSAARLQIIGSKEAVNVCARIMVYVSDCTDAILSGPRLLSVERVQYAEACLGGLTLIQHELVNVARRDLDVRKLRSTPRPPDDHV